MRNQLRFVYVCLALLSIFQLVGCGDSSSATKKDGAGEGKDGAIPKQQFHRPADYATALSRLTEILDAVKNESDLPAPQVFEVVEVRHGSGAGAHSHFYLKSEVDEKEKEMSDQEGHEETEPRKEHQVSVSVQEEWVDVVDWLPAIASDGDMGRKSWDSLRGIVDELREVNKAFKGVDDAAKIKSIFAENEALFQSSLKKMQDLVPKAEGSEKE